MSSSSSEINYPDVFEMDDWKPEASVKPSTKSRTLSFVSDLSDAILEEYVPFAESLPGEIFTIDDWDKQDAPKVKKVIPVQKMTHSAIERYPYSPVPNPVDFSSLDCYPPNSGMKGIFDIIEKNSPVPRSPNPLIRESLTSPKSLDLTSRPVSALTIALAEVSVAPREARTNPIAPVTQAPCSPLETNVGYRQSFFDSYHSEPFEKKPSTENPYGRSFYESYHTPKDEYISLSWDFPLMSEDLGKTIPPNPSNFKFDKTRENSVAESEVLPTEDDFDFCTGGLSL